MTRLVADAVSADPIAQFVSWYDDAVAAGVRQPDAMTLATARPQGAVSARTVLMRGVDDRGFSFYTNLESAKSEDLNLNPRAALVFHWREVER
jgi:pyridoxamine 5'-phosphate oxidase